MKLYLIIKTFFSRHLTPTRIFVSSFAAFIMLGTMALWLPFSAAQSNLRFVDALFTSASAVCVTGLAAVNIGKDLSLIGQLITLVLFQVGGLGIITFSVVLFTLMGRSISF
jgi:trk system potassium uptake protein TrkH